MKIVLLRLVLAAACALSMACVARAGTAAGAAAASVLPPDIGHVPVGGGTLYYEARGSGPSLVLLHAGERDLTMWDPQVTHLARAFRVIRYDARGHGRSTAPRGPYSTVDDLRRLLDHLGIDQARVVGISMGAGVALNFAVAYPERVAKLMLVSTSGPPPGAPIPPGAPPPLTEEAGRARLRTLRMPRMLVVGAEDSEDHLSVAERVQAEVPEVSVVRMAGGRHLLNLELPEMFNDLLLRFFRD